MSTPQHLIDSWLALCHGNPRSARDEWQTQGVALIPMGYRLCAVRLRGDLVRAAVGSDDENEVAAALADRLGGAVISDHRSVITDRYYALINTHAGLVWDLEEDAPCLGEGVFLGVPALQRRRPPGAYWAVPPRYEGDLCRPESVRLLVADGLRELEASRCP
ncbi:hypothetical protein ACFUEN_44985 [Streptomyces griseorubiginosus]|uniref:hypothetical protein n=1 Tax=Streptomyces griseorubiginosus TaxID=67304 RepID=UPI00362E3A9A